MRERSLEACRVHPADGYWTRAVLGLHMILAIFVRSDPPRLNGLLPQDAAGRLVGRRNPRLGLAYHEHPFAELDRRLVIGINAILHVGTVSLARRRAKVKGVKGKP